MSDDKRKQEEWEKAIAAYRQGYTDLVRLGVVLLDGDQDLLRLKETVDGLTEAQANAILTSRLHTLPMTTLNCAEVRT